MGIEIEAKMRLDGVGRLESRLAAIGARRGREVLEDNTYFDTPDGFLLTQDQGLRLRVETDRGSRKVVAIVTHKGPCASGQLKQRAEAQFVADDPQAARQLLVALGFSRQISFEKRRRYWYADACEVVIDTLPYLGDFVEIEGPSQEVVMQMRQTLGLDGLELIRASYIAMLQSHLTQHGTHTDQIRFGDSQTGA